jgi:hypothetical protein
MTKRISLALALAAFAMVAAANATPLSSNVADVAMKRHCTPNNVRCIRPAKPVCLKFAGPKCCVQWGCRRPYKK